MNEVRTGVIGMQFHDGVADPSYEVRTENTARHMFKSCVDLLARHPGQVSVFCSDEDDIFVAWDEAGRTHTVWTFPVTYGLRYHSWAS